MKPSKHELICDVVEALEKINKYKPIYLAVLKHTGSKRDAISAVKYVAQLEEELGEDLFKKTGSES